MFFPKPRKIKINIFFQKIFEKKNIFQEIKLPKFFRVCREVRLISDQVAPLENKTPGVDPKLRPFLRISEMKIKQGKTSSVLSKVGHFLLLLWVIKMRRQLQTSNIDYIKEFILKQRNILTQF